MTEDGLTVPIEGCEDRHEVDARGASHPARRRGTVSSARRHAATEAHLRAVATINEMFDRLDDLTAARDGLTGVAPRQPDDDPIQDAETLLEHARRLGAALDALRTAAFAASTHRARGELAADIGTKNTGLFPRPARQPGHAARLTLAPVDPPPTDASPTTRPADMAGRDPLAVQ